MRISWLPNDRRLKRHWYGYELVNENKCFVCFYCLAGHEGRIGMAAITVNEGAQFDGSKIYNHVVNYLPSYARPRFIRIQVFLYFKHTLLHCCVKKTKKTMIVISVYATLPILDNALSHCVWWWYIDTEYFLLFAHLDCCGGDRNVQANEGEVSGGEFWPRTYPGPSLHPWWSWEELHTADSSGLQKHHIRKYQIMSA